MQKLPEKTQPSNDTIVLRDDTKNNMPGLWELSVHKKPRGDQEEQGRGGSA